MKSFPQPLTAAEEKYYVQKYTEGDLEAKHILIERNLRLVAHIVKKYQPPPEEMADHQKKSRCMNRSEQTGREMRYSYLM